MSNYTIGQRFVNKSSNLMYMLALVSPDQACLIELVSGNRWKDIVKIHDHARITHGEFSLMVGNAEFESTDLLFPKQSAEQSTIDSCIDNIHNVDMYINCRLTHFEGIIDDLTKSINDISKRLDLIEKQYPQHEKVTLDYNEVTDAIREGKVVEYKVKSSPSMWRAYESAISPSNLKEGVFEFKIKQ